MTPYLSLEKSRKNQVLELLEKHCPSDDLHDAVLTTLEEFGDDEDGLRGLLEGMENDRVVNSGLAVNLFQIMEQKPRRRLDWRKVQRRRLKRYK